MIVNQPIIVNGMLAMTGGAGFWLQFCEKDSSTLDYAAFVASMGINEGGRIWYDINTDQFQMWNGTTIVTLG